jgi:DNA uptake protein ComE-like DNA-binding protein
MADIGSDESSAGKRVADAQAAIWTPRQRRIAWLFTAILVIALAICLRNNPQEIASPQDGARSAQITGQLDPNDAPAAMLAVIPHLTQAKARAIVAYRESFVRRHPGRRAFNSLHDLLRVKGLGRQTLEQISPFLDIPPAPTTDEVTPATSATTEPL